MVEPTVPQGDDHARPVQPAPAAPAPGATTAVGTTPAAAATPPLADVGEPTVSADQVKAALRKVKDPDLNLNIVDLGLVYGITVEGATVKVDMSLTSPGCPSGPEIMGDAEQQLRALPGVSEVAMNLVWSPPWTPERIEPRVRAYMGF